MEILINNQSDIDNDLLDYIEEEAEDLAENSSLLQIENYMDREILNPSVIRALPHIELGDVSAIIEPLALSGRQKAKAMRHESMFGFFGKLKKKVNQIFCDIANSIKDLNGKDIIKALLLALVPAFASGIPAIVLPIVIAIIAMYLKKGYSAVCPV